MSAHSDRPTAATFLRCMWRWLRSDLSVDFRPEALPVQSDDGAAPSIHGQVAALEQRLAALNERLSERDAAGSLDADVQTALGGLEKQLSRVGREQFKANTLIETQMQQLNAAFEALRTADLRREAELSALREQSRAAQSAARLDVVQAIIPALDGLDEALRSGQRLLAATQPQRIPPTMIERMFGHTLKPQQASEVLHEGLDAWLVGLTFVRQRLLDVLAHEGVAPITALGEPFDPTLHVAVEVVSASDETPPGTIAAEIRRGYLVHGRVLRHADVAVSRASASPVDTP